MPQAGRFSFSAIGLFLLAGVGPVPVSAATTELVTVAISASAEPGIGTTFPSISSDGRFVAFESTAANLVASDTNGQKDIFVFDRQTAMTTLVSVDSAGSQANGASSRAAISADGRFVAFESLATNLVPGDPSFSQVYVHDRQTGSTNAV